MSPEVTHPSLVDRAAWFLMLAGLLLVFLGLGLDYAYTHYGSDVQRGLPVPVQIRDLRVGQWAWLELSGAYFARRSWGVNPLDLLFWGIWVALAGWLLRQRRRIFATEMDAETLARERRLFRRFRRR